jgi:hypothetical protein
MPQGALAISSEPYQGGSSKLNLAAASTTLIKASGGRIMQINVNVASTGAFSVYDSSTTAGTAASNLVYASSAVVALGTIVDVDFPCSSGIVVVNGAGSVLAVSYL